jgi:hypothetical protein
VHELYVNANDLYDVVMSCLAEFHVDYEHVVHDSIL